MCHVNPRIYFLEFGGTGVGLQVLIRAFSLRVQTMFLEVSIPIDEISRLPGVMLKVIVSWQCTVKRLLYQSMVISNGNNEAFALWKYISF